MNAILIIFKKEWLIEKRSPSGFYASLLFALISVVCVSFACFGFCPSPSLSAGLLSVIMLFSAVIAVPRSFLVEEDQATFSFLRLLTKPSSIFLGKILFNFIQLLLLSFLLTLFFIILTDIPMRNPLLLSAGICAECLVLTAGIGLSSAIAMGGSSRWLLALILSLPLMLPQSSMSIGVLRVALGEGTYEGGLQNLFGLFGFAIAMLAVGTILVETLWTNR